MDAFVETSTAEPASAREQRRLGILRVAREVFLAEGYAAASMSCIAARVGGSKGTLYTYFRSKEELFAAVMRLECEAEADAVFDMEAKDGDVEAALGRLGRRFLSFVLQEKVMAIHRLVAAECARFPELGRIFYEAGPKQGFAKLSAYFEERMAEGRLRRGDPQRMAEQFLELVKSGIHHRRIWNLIDEATALAGVDANVEEAVRVFMAAYGNP